MDIDAIISTSPDTIIQGIAERVRTRRLEKDLTQRAFAVRAGVGYDAYRKFEATGSITLSNLVRCAVALDSADDFTSLFSNKQYKSLDELLESQQPKIKQRGRRNE